MLIKRIRKLPFPNEYVRIVTELLRASFSDLITSRGSSPSLSPAAKNKMIDSVEKKQFSATYSIFSRHVYVCYEFKRSRVKNRPM